MAIRRCIPPGHGKRHRSLFRLCRELKAIPELAGRSVVELQPIVREWHRLSLPYIQTKDFTESWTEFVVMWSRVRHAINVDPVVSAWERAQAMETPNIVGTLGIDSPQIEQLVKLCKALADGRGRFYLDSRKAGNLLEVPHMTAWRYLQFLAEMGVLEITDRGGKRRSARFTYLGD